MPKFTFVCDHSCDLDTHVVTHQFDAETYWEAIAQFEMFLKSAGYQFDGVLDIVDAIEDTKPHSHHYYDEDRNK